MSKQTALDFFFQKISETLGFDSEVYENIEKIFQEAKQMEKEQIINAYEDGHLMGSHNLENTGRQHYRETYGNGGHK